MFGFGKPKCEHCKTEIKEEAYVKDGRKFHSKGCADMFGKSDSKSESHCDCCH